ncbi:MAG: hypothetical protein M0R80_05325 [Proteobacteria bacterium]|jgi:hypothetical protein|nr:hypothetical protein [Pseudomonadota bacterium]
MRQRAIACAVALAVSAFAGNASATVSDYLPVGGVLADLDGTPLDGPYSVVFSLYDDVMATTPIWTETYDALDIDDGLFTAYLGTETPLVFGDLILADELWLGVKVGADSEMDRIAIGSVPFAVEAYQCRQVGSLEEGDIQPILSGANQCADGTFLQGWDADGGVSVCDAPEPEIVITDWASDGFTGWTAPYSPTGGFASFIEYRKMGDMVFLRGAGNAGSTHVLAGQTIATLPVGFRPGKGLGFLSLVRCCSDPAGAAYVYISTSGVIYVNDLVVNPGARQFVYFDGVSFSTLP